MRRVLAAGCAAVVAATAVVVATSREPQQERWVRGKLTAISGSSMTVSSAGKDLVFTVDKNTDIIQEGAGTSTREAQREGRSGVPLDKLLKVGERVEVHYREVDGKLHATEIRGGIAAGDAMGGGGSAQQMRGVSARGTVTAVSDTSLTVKTAEGGRTFIIDEKTRIEGAGFGTRTREMRQKGEKPTLTTFIRNGDYVTVRYHDLNGKLQAEEVQLVRSAPRQ